MICHLRCIDVVIYKMFSFHLNTGRFVSFSSFPFFVNLFQFSFILLLRCEKIMKEYSLPFLQCEQPLPIHLQSAKCCISHQWNLLTHEWVCSVWMGHDLSFCLPRLSQLAPRRSAICWCTWLPPGYHLQTESSPVAQTRLSPQSSAWRWRTSCWTRRASVTRCRWWTRNASEMNVCSMRVER